MDNPGRSSLAIGVDMGGTNLRAAVVDQMGRIQAHVRAVSPIAEPERGQEILIQTIRDVATKADVALHDLTGVGLGIPGWMDRVRKRLTFAPKTVKWENLFDINALEREIDLPVRVDTDPNVATLGELWMGAGRGSRNFIMVTLGTGLGCVIVIDGSLYVGHRGMSGEFGHIVIDPAAQDLCDCGNRGCLESQAAGPAIAREGKRVVESGKQSIISELAGGRVAGVTTATVFAAAARDDQAACDIIARAGELLGIGFATLASLFEPEKIIVGGGMSDLGELILQPIRRTMAKRCYLIDRGYITMEIVPAMLGDDAGVIGAAGLVLAAT